MRYCHCQVLKDEYEFSKQTRERKEPRGNIWCQYHEEILRGMEMQALFQKEHLIRILGTRGGMDEEELGRRQERGAPG